jgi:hypothetical protein
MTYQLSRKAEEDIIQSFMIGAELFGETHGAWGQVLNCDSSCRRTALLMVL